MEVIINPTGILYPNMEEACNAKSRTFSVGINSQLIYQSKIIQLSELKPVDGWKKTNEPEEHLDIITRKILKRIKKFYM